jgi:hypothetical protein
MDVQMAQLGTRLSGRPKGIKDYAKVCEHLVSVRPDALVVLDFEGVEYVSASWISAMLVSLHRRAAEASNDFYLLIANFPEESVDDLQLVADQARVPFLRINTKKGNKSKASLVGTLDPGQVETLSVVQEMGEVTGAELAMKRSDLGTKGPAWNNRLRDLFEKRLLRRRKQGREQIYQTLVPEVIING